MTKTTFLLFYNRENSAAKSEFIEFSVDTCDWMVFLDLNLLFVILLIFLHYVFQSRKMWNFFFDAL